MGALFLPAPLFRKSIVSMKFLPAIPGPEMDAPILWAFWYFFGSFCWKTPMPIKFLLLGGSWGFLEGGGGSANFIFMGAGNFPILRTLLG